MSGIILGTLSILSYLYPTINIQGKYYYPYLQSTKLRPRDVKICLKATQHSKGLSDLTFRAMESQMPNVTGRTRAGHFQGKRRPKPICGPGEKRESHSCPEWLRSQLERCARYQIS